MREKEILEQAIRQLINHDKTTEHLKTYWTEDLIGAWQAMLHGMNDE